MARGQGKARLPRGAIFVAVALVVGMALLLSIPKDGGEADYRSAVERFGQDRIGRLVAGMIPLGIAQYCAQQFGEDPVLLDSAETQVARTAPATRALKDELDAIGPMSDAEKLAIEGEAARRVETLIANITDCDAAIARIESGEFDPPAPAPESGDAQSEGA